jgi:hypothetical protein
VLVVNLDLSKHLRRVLEVLKIWEELQKLTSDSLDAFIIHRTVPVDVRITWVVQYKSMMIAA